MLTFWKDKKVLITGHTGFKGSWLTVFLDLLGAKTIGFALNPRTPDDIFSACGIDERIIDVRGNICDFTELKKVFDNHKPEIVFHLAAQPLVLASYKNCRETYETNVIGTLNVLECIKDCAETKCAVIITTDKVYENNEHIWGYRETDRLGGYDPYSSSKACAEILVASYRNSFLKERNKFVATVRAGNVIGGGDWSPDRIVPDCIKFLIGSGRIELRNPFATRPFQHVIEPLYGYILLAQRLFEQGADYEGAWNFGPDSTSVINVRRLAELIISNWGGGEAVDISAKNAPHESNMLSLDVTKAEKVLGWKPILTIEKAVEMTVLWYKQYIEKAGKKQLTELCEAQIRRYFMKACEV